MTVLLDSSLLIGIAVEDHEHHEAAATWLSQADEALATCPITQGAVVRHIVRGGRPVTEAVAFLAAFSARKDHQFWTDDLSYAELPTRAIVGHRQVTDSYLAQLARVRSGRLATFDRALAAVHPDVAELVPTS